MDLLFVLHLKCLLIGNRVFVTQLNSVAVCINVHMTQGPCTNIVLVQKNILIHPSYRHSGSVVERLLCDWAVAGMIPGLAALLLGAQH